MSPKAIRRSNPSLLESILLAPLFLLSPPKSRGRTKRAKPKARRRKTTHQAMARARRKGGWL